MKSSSRSSLGPYSSQSLGNQPYVKGSNEFEDFTIEGKCLGKGSYAVVRKAIHKPSGKIFACKTYNRLKITNELDIKNLSSELEILQRLDHPSIIGLMEKFEQTRHIHLIMEHGGEKNLKDFLKARKSNWPSVKEIKVLFRKIVEGVKYLHEKDIAHRDLKLMNIVVNDLNNPKIVDFGFARVGVNENFESGCGTPSYMAPELLVTSATKNAGKADIWALGVILFYLLTRTYPFRSLNDNVLFQKIKQDKLNLDLVQDKEVWPMLEAMLAKQQSERPTCEVILAHQWLRLEVEAGEYVAPVTPTL